MNARAHVGATGTAGRRAEAEALGRSKSGFTNKNHAINDVLGNPLERILTERQDSDVGQAMALLQFTMAGAAELLAEKATAVMPLSRLSRAEEGKRL
ncbi:MAG: hypothetical protein ACXWAB_03795 [Methylobacter sp.]